MHGGNDRLAEGDAGVARREGHATIAQRLLPKRGRAQRVIRKGVPQLLNVDVEERVIPEAPRNPVRTKPGGQVTIAKRGRSIENVLS